MSTIKKPSGVRGQPPGHRRSACSGSDHVVGLPASDATVLSNTADFCTKDELTA